MAYLFFSGIHPAPRKELTRKKPLALLDVPPEKVILPLDLCKGPPAQAIVSVGQRVKLGQLVARAGGEGGAAIHASVSGQVTAIEPRPHPWGGESTAVVIANDRADTPCHTEPVADPNALSQEELLERIRNSGIVGMGGGAIPAHVKILEARGRVDTLIVNAAECEPYLTADHCLLLERARQVLEGMRALARVLGVERTFIASESDKLNAIERLERAMRRNGDRVRLRTVPTRFPMGAEKQIVRMVTGREIPPGGKPPQVGCAVFNVATVYAIGQMIRRGQPLTHRVVTVTGGSVARPRNLWVPVGTPLTNLLQSAGGLKEKPDLVLLGGPMTGIVQTELTVPVLKNTGGLVCLAPWERQTDYPAELCLQCGHCLASCPMRLAPVFIQRALENREMDKLCDLHPEDCMECGCCAYSCPCHIRLVDIMRRAKKLVRENGERAV